MSHIRYIYYTYMMLRDIYVSYVSHMTCDMGDICVAYATLEILRTMHATFLMIALSAHLSRYALMPFFLYKMPRQHRYDIYPTHNINHKYSCVHTIQYDWKASAKPFGTRVDIGLIFRWIFIRCWAEYFCLLGFYLDYIMPHFQDIQGKKNRYWCILC